MSPDTIFSAANSIALLGWIILIALPKWQNADRFIVGIIITIFAILYTFLVFQNFQLSDAQKFGSLAGVSELFSHPKVILAGWIHYLAFDLMTGLFISRNARIHGIPHLWLIPVLFLTFMFGPMGLLAYLIIRWAFTKSYFASNYSNSMQ